MTRHALRHLAVATVLALTVIAPAAAQVDMPSTLAPAAVTVASGGEAVQA